MGLFSYIQEKKQCKEIQGIFDRISLIHRTVKYVNTSALKQTERTSFEWSLAALVGHIREIDNICIESNSNTLYHKEFSFQGNQRTLIIIIKELLDEVVEIREALNVPPVYQEEIDLFDKYYHIQ